MHASLVTLSWTVTRPQKVITAVLLREHWSPQPPRRASRNGNEKPHQSHYCGEATPRLMHRASVCLLETSPALSGLSFAWVKVFRGALVERNTKTKVQNDFSLGLLYHFFIILSCLFHYIICLLVWLFSFRGVCWLPGFLICSIPLPPPVHSPTLIYPTPSSTYHSTWRHPPTHPPTPPSTHLLIYFPASDRN